MMVVMILKHRAESVQEQDLQMNRRNSSLISYLYVV